MTDIITIQNVRGYEKDGTVYLNLEDTARGLGFTTVAASGNEVVRWSRVHQYLMDFGVATSCNGDYQSNCPDFIPENIFYRLAMKAKNEVAEKFQAKVADEILPAIRKHGKSGGVSSLENKLQIFSNADFGQLRTVKVNGEIYFVVADICRILDLTNPTVAVERLDSDEKAKLNLGLSGGETNCVNESGLYRLIFASRKPDAKKFQRWVYHEVLPQIRKNGFYFTPDKAAEIANNPDWIIQIGQILKAEREEKERLQEVVEIQNLQISEMTPKASYYDLILQSAEAIPISVIAKDYGMSGKAMNQLLHTLKIQYPMSGTWLVYQNYAKKGYTCTKTVSIREDYTKTYTNWTQKGRLFLYEILKQNGYLPLIEQMERD